MAAKRKETPAPLKPSLMLEHRAVSRPTALDKMRQHRITGRPDAKTGVLLRVLIVASSAQTTGD
jgi:hypothetical protein